MKCEKSGAWLIFTNDEGEKAKYNLGNGQCISPSGREVKTLQTFFRGYTIDTLQWEDPEYRKFVSVVRNRNRRFRNIGSLLRDLSHYAHYEGWILEGFDVTNAYIDEPISAYPKIAKKIVKKYLTHTYSRCQIDIMRYIKDNPDTVPLLNSILSVEDIVDESVYKGIMDSEWRFRQFCDLVRDYGMNPKDLILKVWDYVRGEGLQVYEVISNLRDYNRMAKVLADGKYEKYPKYLLSMHNIIQKNYRSFQEKHDEIVFKKTVDTSLAHTGVSYSIVVPERPRDVQQEGASMNNCVASYVRSIMGGYCQIVFMRSNRELDKSYVTVEIKSGHIVQAKRPYNQAISEEDRKFLETYAKAKGLVVDKRL